MKILGVYVFSCEFRFLYKMNIGGSDWEVGWAGVVVEKLRQELRRL